MWGFIILRSFSSVYEKVLKYSLICNILCLNTNCENTKDLLLLYCSIYKLSCNNSHYVYRRYWYLSKMWFSMTACTIVNLTCERIIFKTNKKCYFFLLRILFCECHRDEVKPELSVWIEYNLEGKHYMVLMLYFKISLWFTING